MDHIYGASSCSFPHSNNGFSNMGYYNPCYHPIPPCLHCQYAWSVQQYHLQQQQQINHHRIHQLFPVTPFLPGGPWEQAREYGDLKFHNQHSIGNSFNTHFNGDFHYSASNPQFFPQRLPITDTLHNPNTQAAKSPTTLLPYTYHPQAPTNESTLHALQTQNHKLNQEIARLTTALSTLSHDPKSLEPTAPQAPHDPPPQHPQTPGHQPSPTLSWSRTATPLPTTSTAGLGSKKGTYTHFTRTVQKTTPWLTPYLPLLSTSDDYTFPPPTDASSPSTGSKSAKEGGKDPQQRKKRCRVGRPLGKILALAHSDDLQRQLCSKHRTRRDFRIARDVVEARGGVWEPWRCPGMPGLAGCGGEGGDEEGEGEEEKEEEEEEGDEGSVSEWVGDVDEERVEG